ncbi:hypothetical protein V5O48_001986 [Marasmius crinis-equi]|uniref:Uncharacterized protein n=1 Tax=Marasmius crinis-equi TaxID=585013 RepID=A0ABR3FX22_9AGAR
MPTFLIGPPRTFSTKGAESADSPKKLRVAAFQATRQTLSALKTVSVFSRVSRLSAVSAEPRSSTTATQSTNLSSRKTSPLRSTLSAGSNSSIVKNGTKEAPRLREGVAANKDRAVDMRRDRAGTGMATNSSQKETNTRKTRSIPSRESPVIPTKTPTPSGPAARTKTLSSTSNLTAPTPGAIGMRRSGVAPSVAKKRALKPRAGSAGARTGTEAASNVTQLHRPNQAATSASTTPRPAIPKHASSNARAAAVSRAQPPSTRLAGITGSSQATTSRSRLVRSPPAQEGVTKRRLVGSSGIEERSRTLARTSKEESPNVPRPVATTSSRRSITRPPLRWR